MADSIWPLPTRDRFAQLSGEIAFASILTGVLAVAPASLRIAATAQGSLFGYWIPLAGIAATVAVAVIFLLRTATGGVLKVVPKPEDRAMGLFALSLWMIMSALSLATLGSLLSATTHHRGLGGTTYAWLGLAAVAVAGLVAWRFAGALGRLSRRSAVAWCAFVAAGVGVSAMALTASRRVGEDDAGTAAAVVDALLFGAMAVATSRIRLPEAHKRIWVPTTVLLLVALIGTGVAMVNHVANAGANARARVLIFAPVIDRIAEPDTQPKRRPAKPLEIPEGSAPVAAQSTPPPGPTSSALPPELVAPQRIDQPDIILVTLDTVRADHLGAYGYERKTSPNLDALAATSTVFERAYAAGPETRTAIAPLVTCKHLVESVRDERSWPTLLHANEMVAERLRGRGYATGAVSSFQWLSKARGFDQGFDIFDEQPFRRVHPEKGITGAHAVAQGIAAYDELTKGDKPVFLWIHMFDAHEAYQGHEAFALGNADVDKYDSEIAYMDRELSRLMEHVGNNKRGAKTVWIVHGSHGEAFGEHGFRGHPPKMFEEVVRVPLIVNLPWAKPARVKDAAVSVLDVPATVLSLAIGDVGDCTGKSLINLAEGTSKDVEGRPMLLVAYDGIHGQEPAYGWLDSRVKYVLYAWRDGEKTRLFDLRADPAEKQNLQSERPGQAIKMREQLDTHLRSQLRRVKESPED